MNKSIHFGHFNQYVGFLHNSLLNLIEKEQTNRIRKLIIDLFFKLSSFFGSFKNQSKEMNLKPIAMISCLSLITLLIVSIFRRRDEGIMVPPTSMNDSLKT